MNIYDESAESLMKRGDEIIAQRKRRSAIIRRTGAAAVAACAALVLGLGVWHSRDLKSAVQPPEPPDIVEISTKPSETTSPLITTTTSVTTQRTTSTRLTETVTTTTQTTELSPQTGTQTTTAPVATSVAFTSTEPVTTATSIDTTQTTTQTATSQSVQTTGTEARLTVVTTMNTNTAIGTLYCFCSMTDSDGKRYYSYEESADTNIIGDFIGTASADLIYQNGYKGYQIGELTVNAEIYEYSEKAVAVRYEGCGEFYIYHAM